LAVNFITICVSVITIYGSVVTICGNLVTIYGKIEKVNGAKATMNGMVEKVNVNIVLKHGNLPTIYNYLIIQLDKYTKLTDKKDPLRDFHLQAHFAGAKRQQHLQKELVLQYIISSSSIIHQDNQNLKQNAQNGNR